MEKVICCLKMQLSVWCTQATWTTAPSSEMGFIATQKLSSIARILVGLQANTIFLTLKEMYLSFMIMLISKLLFFWQQKSWSFVIRMCAAYFNGYTEGNIFSSTSANLIHPDLKIGNHHLSHLLTTEVQICTLLSNFLSLITTTHCSKDYCMFSFKKYYCIIPFHNAKYS